MSLNLLAIQIHILSTVSLPWENSRVPTSKCILVILMSGCWPSQTFPLLRTYLSTQFNSYWVSHVQYCGRWQRCNDWFISSVHWACGGHPWRKHKACAQSLPVEGYLTPATLPRRSPKETHHVLDLPEKKQQTQLVIYKAIWNQQETQN